MHAPRLGIAQHHGIGLGVQQIDRDTVSVAGDRLLENLILLHHTGLLRGLVLNVDLVAGGPLDILSRILGAVIYQIEPGIDHLRHDHESVAVLHR